IARRISSCLRSIAADLHPRRLPMLHRFQERHEIAQFRADFLELLILLALTLCVEPWATLAILFDPVLRVGSILDLREHLAHFLARLVGNNPRSTGVVAMFGRVTD